MWLTEMMIIAGGYIPVPLPDVTTADAGITLLLILVSMLSIGGTILGHKIKARSQEKTSAVEAQAQTTQATLEVVVESLTARLDKVEKEVSLLREENQSLALNNLQLTSVVQTKDDVIDAFARDLSAWEAWHEAGFPNPPGRPTYTWQVRHHMKELLEAVKDSVKADEKLREALKEP